MERDPADAPPNGNAPTRYGAAVLLAATAVVAAVLGVRASMIMGRASDQSDLAVREEVKRAAALVEDVRYFYGVRAPATYDLVQARILAEEYRLRAADAPEEVRSSLLVEAYVQDQLAELMTQGFDVVGDEYATDSGGFDLAEAFADVRRESPDLLAVDPDKAAAASDDDATTSRREVAATIPVAVAFLFGAIGQGSRRFRRPLLAAGWVALTVAAVAAIAIEVS